MSLYVLIEAVKAEGFSRGGMVTAAFGDVVVAEYPVQAGHQGASGLQ